MTPRYSRSLSAGCLALLSPEGPLTFLVSELPGLVAGDPYAFDLQFREGDKLMVYHGTTCLLVMRLSATGVSLSAHASYAALSPGLMRRWSLEEAGELRAAVAGHLRRCARSAASRYYGNQREGYFQNRFCGAAYPEQGARRYVIDRECVIGFKTGEEKLGYYGRIKEKYRVIRDRLQGLEPARWGRPEGKEFGDELDALTLCPGGLIEPGELKHGESGSGIYWGPLQAMVYHEAFAGVIEAISPELRLLIEQKIAVGLLPPEAAECLPPKGEPFRMGPPVLAVAQPKARSGCWRKLGEVMRVLREADPALRMTLLEFGTPGVSARSRAL